MNSATHATDGSVDSASRRAQVLSLAGGGYRGLFTASVLAALERSSARPLGRCFELSAGTSIGGLLALAVAFEIPLAHVVSVFEERGPRIFPAMPSGRIGRLRTFWDSVFRSRFSAAPLREALVELFGATTRLGDAKHAVVIPAVNLTSGAPQIFKTPHDERWVRDLELSVVDIALATSAAPTFFPPAKVKNTLYADGGLFANSPDLVAWHEASHFLGFEPRSTHLLSVGTTTSAYSIVEQPEMGYGLLYWLGDGADPRLPNILISSQQQLAMQIVKHVLADRYSRIDVQPSHEQAPHLGLAIASRAATDTLLALGEKAGTDFLGSASSRDILKHEATSLLASTDRG